MTLKTYKYEVYACSTLLIMVHIFAPFTHIPVFEHQNQTNGVGERGLDVLLIFFVVVFVFEIFPGKYYSILKTKKHATRAKVITVNQLVRLYHNIILLGSSVQQTRRFQTNRLCMY